MKKLNNEELQNVSAGTGDDDNVPTLEDAKVKLLEHGGKCSHCGTPVQEFVPYKRGWFDGWRVDYLFYCKCSWRWNTFACYFPDSGEWVFPCLV